MRRYLILLLCLFLFFISLAQMNQNKPNVILIVSDDQGWSDVGFNGCTDIPTPNLDKLASSGVIFTSGYAPHSYCSPSRAGILTGRYQQRFGHECNPGYLEYEDEVADGLPLSETLMSNIFQDAGYKTAAIGKWHLGDAKQYWPIKRGFDYWYGFSGGGMSYWGNPNIKRGPLSGVLENGKVVPLNQLSHLTDDFSAKAVEFIQRNKENPFFMYLAYNAPHAPDHATKEHLKATEHVEYGGRAVYGAMVSAMDKGIGDVLDELENQDIRENTIVIFLSDNGGRGEHAINFPYRGHKGMLFEGGIRVPFCISWPAAIPSGQSLDEPVTGLDILPTLIEATNIDAVKGLAFDGINILPILEKKQLSLEDRMMFWRYSGGEGWVARQGGYKLIHSHYKGKSMLFNLDNDPYEHEDISQGYPEIVERLKSAYIQWDSQMMEPLWEDPHIPNVEREENKLKEIKKKASAGEK